MSENPKAESGTMSTAEFAIPEFDERMAFETIDEILMLPTENNQDAGPGHVVTPHLQAKLDCAMPLEAYAIGAQSGHAYVPGFLIDYIARGLFRDMWDTEVINAQILHQGARMVPSSDASHRGPQKVFQVVAMATVRVTLRGENGTCQTHTEVGTGAYQVSAEDPSIESAYQIAIKGAARDARQRALGHFGRVFNVRGQNQEELLERLQQRRSIDAEIDAAPTQIPFVSRDAPSAPVYKLHDTMRNVTVSVPDERGFVDAYVAAIETTTTIAEMETFVKANAETLKHMKEIGAADTENRISGAIDGQYLSLSQFESGHEEKQDAAVPAEPDEKPTGQAPQEKADEISKNTETARPEEAGPAEPGSDAVETGKEDGNLPPVPVIPFTLGENGKIRKAKTYIKAFLAAIEAATSRESLNLLMDANQENLKRLPRSEIQAVNTVAQARAKKSGEFAL